jgi:hypothetical protein
MHGGGRESKERMMIKNEERPGPHPPPIMWCIPDFSLISVFSEPLGEGKAQ